MNGAMKLTPTHVMTQAGRPHCSHAPCRSLQPFHARLIELSAIPSHGEGPMLDSVMAHVQKADDDAAANHRSRGGKVSGEWRFESVSSASGLGRDDGRADRPE